MFEEFERAVLDCLNELLREHESQLPCKFKFVSGRRLTTDGPLDIQVEPEGEWPRPENCSEVFAGIQKSLVQRFEGHKSYFGLALRVPHEYLDYKTYIEQKAEQSKDNQRFRRIRLKGHDHG